MASIRKRIIEGEVRYDVTVTRRGAPRQTRTFQTKAAAERWARETERDIERGAWRSTDVAERMTVAELLTRYDAEVLARTRSPEAWHSVAMKLARSPLSNIPLIALRRDAVAEHREKRLKTPVTGGGPFGKLQKRLTSPQTVRTEVALLRRAIDHAMAEWRLHLPAGNPAEIVLPKAPRSRDRRAEGDEMRRLLAEAYASRSPHLGHAIEFAVETAMRRGELCGLRWADVDLKARTAKILKTKNGKPRVVPLSGRAIELLTSISQHGGDGPIFSLSPGGFSQAFKRICDRVGIPNMRLHDMRHEATSRLAVKLNGDVMALSAITGHETLQMLKRYTHLKAEELAKRIA